MMALDFDAGNLGKLNGALSRPPAAPVKGGAATLEAFKKADADGNGTISRDEFTRFAKDAVSRPMDLSKFMTQDVPLGDFDQALSDWAASVDEAAPATAVSDKASALPPLDTGKTNAKGAAEKIARGEDLNFGHNAVDGQLWKMEGGSPVWADTGTQVTRAQLAAMPDYQVSKFYQMMGLGYDAKRDFPDPAERQKLAATATKPDPGSPMAAAGQKLEAIGQDLDAIHEKVSSRETSLKAMLAEADPVQAMQINAQLAQLGGFRQKLEGMRAEIKDLALPLLPSAQAEQRVGAALDAVHQSIRELAGADAGTQGDVMAKFTLQMNQLREPERDMRQDALAQNQYTTLLDANRLMSGLEDRMSTLMRQAEGVDAGTAHQISAQLAQLQNLHQGLTQVTSPLKSFRPDPALSDAERQEKAALVDSLHTELKRMAGMDRESFQKAVAQLTQQLEKL